MNVQVYAAVVVMLLGQGSYLAGQSAFRFRNATTEKLILPFELSQNLIIIPSKINQSSNLQLVLDSGIGNTIITGLTRGDTISMIDARKIQVGGLGDGTPIEAFFSKGNKIEIENPENLNDVIIGSDLDIYLLTTDQFELSRQLGVRVNGLIGSDLFENFVIKIDPLSKQITFYDRDRFNFKRGTRSYSKIPLEIMNGKAFVEVKILQENDSSLNVKLLIDTGASLSMWVAPFSDPSIVIPQKTVRSLLGQGLNGAISGVNGRVRKVEIGPFVLKRALVSYPDSACVSGLTLNAGRHGSLGNDILKRFNVVFDFQGSALYLQPNKLFKTPFSYNRSGMDVEKIDPMIPIYTIFSIIPGSSADKAGLKPGDIIEYLNYLPAFNLSLDDINSVLYGESGKLVLLRVNRNGEQLKFKFYLEVKI